VWLDGHVEWHRWRPGLDPVFTEWNYMTNAWINHKEGFVVRQSGEKFIFWTRRGEQGPPL